MFLFEGAVRERAEALKLLQHSLFSLPIIALPLQPERNTSENNKVHERTGYHLLQLGQQV